MKTKLISYLLTFDTRAVLPLVWMTFYFILLGHTLVGWNVLVRHAKSDIVFSPFTDSIHQLLLLCLSSPITPRHVFSFPNLPSRT